MFARRVKYKQEGAQQTIYGRMAFAILILKQDKKKIVLSFIISFVFPNV
jgi:hypothetical protein